MEDNKRRRTFTAMRLSRCCGREVLQKEEPTRATVQSFFSGDRDVLSLLPVFSVRWLIK